jgi:hypothetical protein
MHGSRGYEERLRSSDHDSEGTCQHYSATTDSLVVMTIPITAASHTVSSLPAIRVTILDAILKTEYQVYSRNNARTRIRLRSPDSWYLL